MHSVNLICLKHGGFPNIGCRVCLGALHFYNVFKRIGVIYVVEFFLLKLISFLFQTFLLWDKQRW